ncbi:MAG: phospholipase, partial [Actinobacteria bacterium]|nr:phospholipase [Actinomycetota bacterium]
MSPGRRTGPGLQRIIVLGVLVSGLIAACTPLTFGTSRKPGQHLSTANESAAERVAGGATGTYVVPAGIHKIKHVIILMQENRSFDSLFGTYPGADGIPMRNGKPTVCVPNTTKGCTKPYHDTADVNGGGPHALVDDVKDVDGGKMDGFVRQRDKARLHCATAYNPACTPGMPDVMGYHTAAELPNYWAYAKNFALDDQMFEAVNSWSLPQHEYLLSEWAARCRTASPESCVNDPAGQYSVSAIESAVRSELTTGQTSIDLAWTDITWLLYMHHVSWGYYVQDGWEPDCRNDASVDCAPVRQSWNTPGIWNPLPLFSDVREDGQLGNVKPLGDFLTAAKKGTLPAVSWVVPSADVSDHPPAGVHMGQAY